MKLSTHKINDWLADRPWRRCWRCLPALLAGLLCLGVLALAGLRHTEKTELALRYRRIATAALAGGKFETARVAALRGLSLTEDKPAKLEWLFYLAAALNGLGHPGEASELLATVAPLDHPGYLEAHLAVAQSLLGATNITSESLRMAEKHLQNALALDPESLDIKELLGRFCINTHQLDKARRQLLEIYPGRREAALLLALVEKASDHPAEARMWQEAAVQAFKKNLQDLGPRDSQADRLSLVRALLLEDDFAKAAQTLEAGLQLQDDPAYRSALGDVCALWAARLVQSPGSAPPGPVEVLREGLTNAPQHLKLAAMLIGLSGRADATGAQARALLQQQVTQAPAGTAARWQLLLAAAARQAGKPADSRSHLEAAYKLAPEMPEAANDLAMDLAFGTPPELARALALSEQLVARFPTNANFCDTRKRIRTKAPLTAKNTALTATGLAGQADLPTLRPSLNPKLKSVP